MKPSRFCAAILTALFTVSVSAQQAGVAPEKDSATAPKAQASSQSSAQQAHTLLDGTPVKMRITQTISSADAKVNQEIPFEVIEDVKVDGVVVLPKGAVAIGTVTAAEHKKSMGRAGKLNISISYARLSDNQKVALRATKDTKGGGHVGAMTTAMVATSLVFFPAAPLLLFVHGKDITIPQGTEITAFVEGDMHLDMSQFGPQSGAAPTPSAAAGATQPTLAIDSTPSGADIEIDGTFVGNTPSTVNAAAGSHEVVVKKKGFADWSRKLNVTGGSIHLSADLDPLPQK